MPVASLKRLRTVPGQVSQHAPPFICGHVSEDGKALFGGHGHGPIILAPLALSSEKKRKKDLTDCVNYGKMTVYDVRNFGRGSVCFRTPKDLLDFA